MIHQYNHRSRELWTLAMILGVTVGDLRSRMTIAELSEWLRFLRGTP